MSYFNNYLVLGRTFNLLTLAYKQSYLGPRVVVMYVSSISDDTYLLRISILSDTHMYVSPQSFYDLSCDQLCEHNNQSC